MGRKLVRIVHVSIHVIVFATIALTWIFATAELLLLHQGIQRIVATNPPSVAELVKTRSEIVKNVPKTALGYLVALVALVILVAGVERVRLSPATLGSVGVMLSIAVATLILALSAGVSVRDLELVAAMDLLLVPSFVTAVSLTALDFCEARLGELER